ncbi:hypothetical protein PghCCS26_18420 [Paenibacillus glycanilyticus]|uniref:B30.2/SPRY domain-containing protein n=1 Tax=Paenibacillus glycanilyticus TaxID=126569 RepID=A0ABQ6NL17_9BACL|nr:hypothetical protein PghCCS26_18420 [Paenibacillus glycanilyticus]
MSKDAIGVGVDSLDGVFLFATTGKSTLQILSKDEYRARVTSVYSPLVLAKADK